jgi:hypothetical protein
MKNITKHNKGDLIGNVHDNCSIQSYLKDYLNTCQHIDYNLNSKKLIHNKMLVERLYWDENKIFRE